MATTQQHSATVEAIEADTEDLESRAGRERPAPLGRPCGALLMVHR